MVIEMKRSPRYGQIVRAERPCPYEAELYKAPKNFFFPQCLVSKQELQLMKLTFSLVSVSTLEDDISFKLSFCLGLPLLCYPM